MTFTDGAALTAAQLNTHLRDNLMETATAKANGTAGWFVATGRNQITQRTIASSRVGTAESTSAQDWTDLATPGPAVTLETGTRALVLTKYNCQDDTNGVTVRMGVALSGATERDPLTASELRLDGVTAGNSLAFSGADLITTLTPGTNTFTCKYKVGSGTGTFRHRNLIVIAM
jgi:hypothetical protein